MYRYDGIPASPATVHLAAGEAYLITIFFANVGGLGQADLAIKMPDGRVLENSTPFLVGDC